MISIVRETKGVAEFDFDSTLAIAVRSRCETLNDFALAFADAGEPMVMSPY